MGPPVPQESPVAPAESQIVTSEVNCNAEHDLQQAGELAPSVAMEPMEETQGNHWNDKVENVTLASPAQISLATETTFPDENNTATAPATTSQAEEISLASPIRPQNVASPKVPKVSEIVTLASPMGEAYNVVPGNIPGVSTLLSAPTEAPQPPRSFPDAGKSVTSPESPVLKVSANESLATR